MARRIVIGDIHGCFFTLKALMEQKVKPAPEDQIFFVGDLIDRGPRTKDVLDYIIFLSSQEYQIFPLRGNHEDMCLKALKNESHLQTWYANGAKETLRSFGVPEYLIYDAKALKFIPDNYIQFMIQLPYYYDLGDFLVVHAGINFENDDIFEDLNAMLWSRKIEYKSKKIGNRTIIHGHTPMPFVSIRQDIKKQGNKNLNIDAGCVYKDLPGYGILTAIDLDKKDLLFQENID